jgi:hypothetical protein
MERFINALLTLTTSLLFILPGFSQSPVSTKDDADIAVNIFQLPDKNKLRVILVSPSSERFNVLVKNKNGDIVFEENLKEKNFSQDLNFSEMKSDGYTIEIRSKNFRYSRELYVRDRLVEKEIDLTTSADVASKK